MIRLIIVDDHKVVTEGLSNVLGNEPDIEISGQCSNGAYLLGMLNHTPADVVLLDINMPEMNGLETLKKIKETHPSVRVLILSMHGDPKNVINCIEAGADGYILKEEDINNIKKGIRDLHDGGNFFSNKLMGIITGKIKGDSGTSQDKVKITRREKEVMQLIANGKSNEEVTEELFISAYTLKSHLRNIYRKLDLRGKSDMVSYYFKNNLED